MSHSLPSTNWFPMQLKQQGHDAKIGVGHAMFEGRMPSFRIMACEFLFEGGMASVRLIVGHVLM